jgi:hypothetical protein
MTTKKTTKTVKKKAEKLNTKSASPSKQKSVNKTKTVSDEYNLVFSIHARAIKQEDYSGATFSEWFDSGTDDYSLAKPDDYFKKGKFYEVIWSNKQSIKPNISLVERIFKNITMWAGDFEAFFLPDSKITVLDNKNNTVKVFEF